MKLKIQLLVDNKTSWIIPYVKSFKKKLIKKGFSSNLIHEHKNVISGDILVLLSCERIFKNLKLNRYNLVIHESNLPHGKGWSPLTYQVLEGKNKIPITLFEASTNIDTGGYYYKDEIFLHGNELISEIREKQAKKTFLLLEKFIYDYKKVVKMNQKGISTFYKKRTLNDSQLNENNSIVKNFNLLRVVDNEKYPAFFRHKGCKYIIKIYKDEEK
jgi:methionyl-tRNA formyltransferase|tara:strand:+ start:1501 stop:2145 length:645 start_codon:yes stop_codon:yes gene_type:complete